MLQPAREPTGLITPVQRDPDPCGWPGCKPGVAAAAARPTKGPGPCDPVPRIASSRPSIRSPRVPPSEARAQPLAVVAPLPGDDGERAPPLPTPPLPAPRSPSQHPGPPPHLRRAGAVDRLGREVAVTQDPGELPHLIPQTRQLALSGGSPGVPWRRVTERLRATRHREHRARCHPAPITVPHRDRAGTRTTHPTARELHTPIRPEETPAQAGDPVTAVPPCPETSTAGPMLHGP